MEDPRLSRMYARLLSSNVASRRRRFSEWVQRHLPQIRRGLLVLLVLGLAGGYYLHLQGRFRRLKVELQARRETAPQAELPGGQEPVVLTRSTLGDGSFPELVSATLLPGRGMSVQQITAMIPGRGEVKLLAGPDLEQATGLLSGAGDDQFGARTLQLGGPVEVPWAGPLASGECNDGQVTTAWHGRMLAVPCLSKAANRSGSEGGLLLRAGAETVSRDVMPDGGSVQANFSSSAFSARWPSQLAITTSVLLSGRALDFQIQVRNTGREPTPVGVGWLAHLLLPGNRRDLLVRLPAQQYVEQRDGRVTGRLVDVAGTPLDFMGRSGKVLGTANVANDFVFLKTGFLENGPTVELRDPAGGFGLRLTALSSQIRALHMEAHPDSNVISLAFQTNYPDPLSHAWPASENTGLFTLDPGQVLKWRVRLELIGMSTTGMPPL